MTTSLLQGIAFFAIQASVKRLKVDRCIAASERLWFYVINYPALRGVFAVAVVIHLVAVWILAVHIWVLSPDGFGFFPNDIFLVRNRHFPKPPISGEIPM